MAVNYQSKSFLKESFYTLKNNIGIGENMEKKEIKKKCVGCCMCPFDEKDVCKWVVD